MCVGHSLLQMIPRVKPGEDSRAALVAEGPGPWGGLKFGGTPGEIWRAGISFLDEISRCRSGLALTCQESEC